MLLSSIVSSNAFKLLRSFSLCFLITLVSLLSEQIGVYSEWEPLLMRISHVMNDRRLMKIHKQFKVLESLRFIHWILSYLLLINRGLRIFPSILLYTISSWEIIRRWVLLSLILLRFLSAVQRITLNYVWVWVNWLSPDAISNRILPVLLESKLKSSRFLSPEW